MRKGIARRCQFLRFFGPNRKTGNYLFLAFWILACASSFVHATPVSLDKVQKAGQAKVKIAENKSKKMGLLLPEWVKTA